MLNQLQSKPTYHEVPSGPYVGWILAGMVGRSEGDLEAIWNPELPRIGNWKKDIFWFIGFIFIIFYRKMKCNVPLTLARVRSTL